MQIAQDSATATSSLSVGIAESNAPARGVYADYKVIRRNGAVVGFEPAKVSVAMTKAFLAVNGSQAAQSKALLEANLLRTGDAREIQLIEKVSIIAVIGSYMRGYPGTAGRVFTAAGRAGVNIMAIAQGSSELSISFIVKAEQGPDAVRVLHEEFLGAKAV